MFEVGYVVPVLVVGLDAKLRVAVAFAVLAPKKPREAVRDCGLPCAVPSAYRGNSVAEVYGYVAHTLEVDEVKAFNS